MDDCKDRWSDVICVVVKKNANGNMQNVLQRLDLAAVVYCLWGERNNNIFNKIESTVDSIVKQVMDLVKPRLQG